MNSYDSVPNIWKRDGNRMVQGDWSDPVLRSLWLAEWEATEKLDGTSVRIGLDEELSYFVKGRTDKSQLPPALIEHCRSLEDAVRGAFDGSVCLYGEGVGKGIQKGGHLFGPDQRLVLFDVKVGRFWLERHGVEEVSAGTGIPAAPVTYSSTTLKHAVELMLEGPPMSWMFDGTAEGWVMRPVGGLLHRDGTPVRVKLKERDFKVLREGRGA